MNKDDKVIAIAMGWVFINALFYIILGNVGIAISNLIVISGLAIYLLFFNKKEISLDIHSEYPFICTERHFLALFNKSSRGYKGIH